MGVALDDDVAETERDNFQLDCAATQRLRWHRDAVQPVTGLRQCAFQRISGSEQAIHALKIAQETC